jgi:hypothetical protein
MTKQKGTTEDEKASGALKRNGALTGVLRKRFEKNVLEGLLILICGGIKFALGSD